MPNFLTAAEMNSLKVKVKAEMQRRAYNGSMTGFASASYDFSTTPTSGTKVTADQGKKVVEPLLNIKDHGNLNIVDLKTGSKIPSSFSNELLSYTDSLSQEPIDGASSSCRGACSGLCVGTCGSTCSGCSSCSGGCTGSGGSGGSGSSGCGGCSGGCSGACSGCGGSCTGSCGRGCSSSCAGCSGGCEGCTGCAGCGGSCSTSCSSSGKGSSCGTCYGCTGCASSCSSCSSGCGGGCIGCSGCGGCTGCSTNCDGCSGTCSGGCGDSCSGCSGGCSGCSGCGSGCYGSCTGACDGCSNGCSGQCKNACATTCSATCTGTCQAQAFGAVVSGGAVEDPTVDLIANGEWTYKVNTNLVTAKSVSVTRKGTEYNFNIDGLTILNQKTNLGSTAITFINENDALLGPSEMSSNEPTIKLDSNNRWHLVPNYPTYSLKINNGTPLASFANTYYRELHFNIKV